MAISKNEEETKEKAKKIIQQASKHKSTQATVIALNGELGAGKTVFTKGAAKFLGIKENISSPTFVIWKKYKIKSNSLPWKTLIHVDLYRIEEKDDLKNIGLKKEIDNPENIVIIEWAKKAKKILPKRFIEITMEHGDKENERKIIIK